jgi:ABC-type glutathione transport system ATPase component
MWRERGLTMVLVTHDSTVARRAQRIGVLKKGLLSFRQPARDLTAERLRPPRSGGCGFRPRRRMTNGVIRGRAAVGGCPTRDNPPAVPGNGISFFR